MMLTRASVMSSILIVSFTEWVMFASVSATSPTLSSVSGIFESEHENHDFIRKL